MYWRLFPQVPKLVCLLCRHGLVLNVAVPVMALNHSIIGVAEGFVTIVLIATLLKLRPDVLEKSPILVG